MVVLKTYRSLFYDILSGNIDLRMAGQFLLLVFPWAVFQFIMLEKFRRKLLRLLPLMLLLLCILFGEIMTKKTSGWDGLGWGILTNYFAYGLLGELCGITFWAVWKKGKKSAA